MCESTDQRSELAKRLRQEAREFVRSKCFSEWMVESVADACLQFALERERKVRRETLEEAARLALQMGSDWWEVYKGRKPSQPEPLDGDPKRADSYTEGMSDGADYVGAAIMILGGLKRD